MSLLFQTARQAVPVNCLPATPAVGSSGVVVTPNASANVKGSWSELFSAVPYDVYGITLGLTVGSAAGAVYRHLVDIAVGASGSEIILVPNILITPPNAITTGPPISIFLPLFIPKGTRLSARSQCTVGGQPTCVAAFLHGGFDSPPWKTFQNCDAIGIDASTTSGTPVAGGASAGVEGSWTDVGSVTARRYGAIFPTASMHTSTTVTGRAYHLEWGIGGVTLGERLFCANSSEFLSGMTPDIPDYSPVPIGSQLQIRTESSGASDTLQYGFLALY